VKSAIVVVLIVFLWLLKEGLIPWPSDPNYTSLKVKLTANRRPFRFSVRALLVALTLAAVVLGVWAWSR
jgi:hypothetical protein